ncbi:MAG: PorT family protein [Bacteroidales bacterium]|nr:PorT family protein [Bacteroidales bacterium]
MNKVISIIILLIPSVLNAQEGSTKVQNYQDIDNKAIHFGFSLGTNISDFTFIRNKNAAGKSNYKLDLNEPLQTIGFNVNIVSEYRLNKYFSLRFTPGLILTSDRPIICYNTFGDNIDTSFEVSAIESNYLDFPFYVKFSSKRINNYKPYLLTGGSFRYDLVARKNYTDKQAVKLQKTPPIDLTFDFGFGIDYYLVYFKLSTELKLSTGLMNVLYDKPPTNENLTEYWNTLDGMRSSMIILSFSFE